MNDNYLAMTEGVKEFLSELGLEQYYEIFVTKGYDSESDVQNLQDDDLDQLGISDQRHRQLLLTAAYHYAPSDQYKLYEWLRQNQLDYYLVNFIQSELTDFRDISNLNLPDEDLYDELELVLPGHRRRLERAVQQLRKRRKFEDTVPEEPLAVGRWGKPSALVDAKYDFLCVEAIIASTKNTDNVRKMDFMVDSGSDVVTLRKEILESLDLELLGTVRSKGVHASREKRLYKAKLMIGDRQIEIEVMPESYDSLGSRVIRHFRHFIDGNRHVWLPGNYSEPFQMSTQPTMSPQSDRMAHSITHPQEEEVTVFSERPNAACAPMSTPESDAESGSVSTERHIPPGAIVPVELPETSSLTLASERPNSPSAIVSSGMTKTASLTISSEVPNSACASVSSEVPNTACASVSSEVPNTACASVSSEVLNTPCAPVSSEVLNTQSKKLSAEGVDSPGAPACSELPNAERLTLFSTTVCATAVSGAPNTKCAKDFPELVNSANTTFLQTSFSASSKLCLGAPNTVPSAMYLEKSSLAMSSLTPTNASTKTFPNSDIQVPSAMVYHQFPSSTPS